MSAIDYEDVSSRTNAAKDLYASLNETFDLRLFALSNQVLQVFANSKKIAFVGNGGSAAEAMHLSAEFTGKCVIDHKPLPAICLNESQSSLTAIANDYGVEHTFSRLVEAYLVEGDLLIALSTSGKSPNILKALALCTERGITPILWTGLNAPEILGVDVWRVPSLSTPRIQEVHLTWGHILAEVVEIAITPQGRQS